MANPVVPCCWQNHRSGGPFHLATDTEMSRSQLHSESVYLEVVNCMRLR